MLAPDLKCLVLRNRVAESSCQSRSIPTMRQSATPERPAGFWRVLMGGVLSRHPQKHKTPPERRGVDLGCEILPSLCLGDGRAGQCCSASASLFPFGAAWNEVKPRTRI